MTEFDNDTQPAPSIPEYRRLLGISGGYAAPGNPLRKSYSILYDGLPEELAADHTVGQTNELSRVDTERKYTVQVDVHTEIAGLDNGTTRKKNGAVRVAFIPFSSKEHNDESYKTDGWISLWSDGSAEGYAELNPGFSEVDADFLRSLGLGDHPVPGPDDRYPFIEHQLDGNDMNQLADTLITFLKP